MNTSQEIRIQDLKILYYSLLTIDRTTASPCHSHSYYEFTYIYDGSGIYDIDGVKTGVSKGDILLFPPGVVHGEILEKGSRWTMLVIGFDGIDFSAVFNPSGQTAPFVSKGGLNGTLSQCCCEIYQELLSCAYGYRLVVKGLLEKLAVLLLRSNHSENEHSEGFARQVRINYSDRKDIVEKIKQYIDFYYSSKISLEEIAQNAYLSPGYIIRLFKEECGETPINYLIKVRLHKAKELLAGKKSSLETIAHMVGYTDVIHFSKIFKKYNGMSPKRYQEEHAE